MSLSVISGEQKARESHCKAEISGSAGGVDMPSRFPPPQLFRGTCGCAEGLKGPERELERVMLLTTWGLSSPEGWLKLKQHLEDEPHSRDRSVDLSHFWEAFPS
ncbi:hypothetical protein Anapl_15497 [Anas platyrhynchos]|uniref:Uncharacterized protein n=1 Tax=Anas platyrhynchos TaxID=8839 RepID=R0L312_ANAPL|nr:hypothetical protein Anapl_15497 [Anas platyrhynchos]